MKSIQETNLELIAKSGEAKGCYIQAIECMHKQDMKGAHKMWLLGNEKLLKAHNIHKRIIELNLSKKSLTIDLLMVHAEDQLMSAEIIKIFEEQFYHLYSNLSIK